MNDDWPHLLRLARTEVGMTQRELGRLAGVSSETVRAYERGVRTPRRAHLVAVLAALHIDNAKCRAILEGAGFVAPSTMFPAAEFPGFHFTAEQLQHEVETVPWAEFVLNDAIELVAANATAQRLWGIDLAQERSRRTRPELNLLSVAAEQRFTERMLNWNECITTLIGVLKGSPRHPSSIDEPDPYFNRVLESFAEGDPGFLAPLANAWMTTPPSTPKTRWAYEVVWHDLDFGDMRFHCLVSNASEPDSYSFNDWIPVDAQSWSVLEQVKQRTGVQPLG